MDSSNDSDLSPENDNPRSDASAFARHVRFGPYCFQTPTKTLLKNNQPFPLEDKMADLLSMLIKVRPQVISKEDLLEQLWPDTVVSDWSVARLVSDTRKRLDDDGQQQQYIKTVRGKGFSFCADTTEVIAPFKSGAVASTTVPRYSTTEAANSQSGPGTVAADAVTAQPLSRLALFNGVWFLAAAVAITLVLLFLNARNQTMDSVTPERTGSARQAAAHQVSDEHLLQLMQRVQRYLNLTRETFLAQVRRRNELGESLLARYPEAQALSWEARFQRYSHELNAQERFLFEQLHAMTEGPLHDGNRALYELMERHPELFQTLPQFTPLQAHLAIWLSKYDRVFLARNDMPLVYVGVEDGVPFPSDIDQAVADWLIAHTVAPANGQ